MKRYNPKTIYKMHVRKTKENEEVILSNHPTRESGANNNANDYIFSV